MSPLPAVTRREIIASGAAVAAVAAFSSTPGSDRVLLGGRVLEDGTGGGRGPARRRGIQGVLVSNGMNVAVTDEAGRWQLPSIEDGHVFVIKPPGWRSPVRACGLPDFHIEAGRAGSLDFFLQRTTESERFEVALLADTQPQSAEELGFLRDAVLPAVLTSGVAFAINHGDIVFDAPELYPRYLDLVAASGLTWHHCPGNHDMDHRPSGADCFSTWKHTFGPCHYAFRQGRATFIVLNNVERIPGDGLTKSGHGYRGAIGERQLAFVRNLLAHIPREDLVVLSMHIPLVGFEDPNDPAGITRDREELLRLLSGRPNTLTLAGHTHTTEHHYLGREQGFAGPGHHHHHVLTAACGSWWSGPYDSCGLPIADSRDGTPKGFHVLGIDGSTYTTRFHPVGLAGNPQMRISIESRQPAGACSLAAAARPIHRSPHISREQLGSASVVVNLFDGGPRSSASYRIIRRPQIVIESERIAMSRRAMADPFTIESYGRHKQDLKPWVEPAPSSHVWQAALPERLVPGSYQLIVECHDEYGRRHSGAILLEVEA